MTLYDTLGVPTDASAEEIKAARRRRASEAHPDKGGSDEEMQRVNHAYEVLSDPDRRAQYDRDGTERALPPIEEEARNVLRALVARAIDNDANIVKLVKDQVRQAQNNVASILAGEQRTIARFEKRRARVRTKPGVENLAHQMIDAKIRSARQRIAETERLRQVNAHLSALIEAYEDDTEQESVDSIFTQWARQSRP